MSEPEPTTPPPEPTTPPPPAPPSSTFSQSDVDRIVSERLAREREKFADYDTLKEAAGRLAEIEAANQTELEKAQKVADEATARLESVTAELRARTLREAVKDAATAAGAVQPDDVFALLGKDSVTIDDTGQVTGAKEAVEQLLKDKPYLRGATPAGGLVGAGASGNEPEDLGTLSMEEYIKRTRGA